MSLRRAVFFIVAALSCSVAVAQANWQPATLVTTDGRTQQGRVDDRNWLQHFGEIRWRSSGETTPRVIPLDDVDRLTVGDRRYLIRTVSIDQGPRDVRRLTARSRHERETVRAALLTLVDGPLGLYEYFDRRSNSHFFLSERGGEPEWLPFARYRAYDAYERAGHQQNNGYRGRLAAALDACPGIATEVRQLAYERSALLGLFERYYNCGPQRPRFRYEPRRNALLFGPDLGLTQTTASYGRLPPDVFRFVGLTSVDLTAGAHLKYRFGGRTGAASLRLAAAYHQFNIARSRPADFGERIGGNRTLDNNYLAEERSLHFQLGPQFVFAPTRYPIFIESYIEYHRILRYTEFQFARTDGPPGEDIVGTPLDFSDRDALGLTLGFGVLAGRGSLSVRATAVRRAYDQLVLNLYRLTLWAGYDF